MVAKYKGQLSKMLEDRGIKQSHLAKESGVPQPFISRFDKSEQYNIHNLFAIANALGVRIEDLFTVSKE